MTLLHRSCVASYVIVVYCIQAVSYLIHGFGWVVGSLVLVRNLPLFDF